MEVTIRHHALEAGCFVINSTGWLTDEQITSITPDPNLQRALRGGCCTAIVSPEGVHLAPPLKEGEGLLIADLDMSLVTKRKRMMDSVGHYARPELLSLNLDDRPTAPVHAMSRSVGSSGQAFDAAATTTSQSPSTEVFWLEKKPRAKSVNVCGFSARSTNSDKHSATPNLFIPLHKWNKYSALSAKLLQRMQRCSSLVKVERAKASWQEHFTSLVSVPTNLWCLWIAALSLPI